MTWKKSVRTDADHCYVSVEGRLDSAVADQVCDDLLDLVAATPARVVVLEMSRVTALGATAAAGLLLVAATARRDGREFVVGPCRPSVRAMLVTVGVTASAPRIATAERIAGSSMFRAFTLIGAGRARRAVRGTAMAPVA